ncbi:hypothetical protein BGZ76_010913 [Entomortierella beljakovae]|nr:hypothetical protein BGZ76_010913 [Entomortierella beljakovae]
MALPPTNIVEGLIDSSNVLLPLCEWTITSTGCRDSDFMHIMMIASTVCHFLVGCFGFWLIIYRNHGFNSKIVTNLFIPVGTGIRPKPMDCMIFFMTVSCLVRILANIPLIFDILPYTWVRIFIEQLFWVTLSLAIVTYFVGLLYAMPITTRDGIFAVYQPETPFGSKPLPPIHVLTPTTMHKNIVLFATPTYIIAACAILGAISGTYYDKGDMDTYKIMLKWQYGNWVFVMYTTSLLFFYYGLKYTFILRANIIVAEAALKAPRAAFGIGNIRSRSPARFLFIQLQITGFGGCAVTFLAGTLCLLWAILREKILSMENERLAHTMAVFWTCAMALAFLVVNSLVAAQSVRSRRRNMFEPAVTTHAEMPNHSRGSNKASSRQKSDHYSNNKVSKSAMSLTHGSTGDISTVHSGSFDKNSFEQGYDTLGLDLEKGPDGESYLTTSLTPPPRPLTIHQFSPKIAPNLDPDHSEIRESVFGGRTPRDETSRNTNSHPHSPTSGGFSLIAFPKSSLRSSHERNNSIPRHSSSSESTATPSSPSYHTTSFTTLNDSTRYSRSSSKYGPSSPTSNQGWDDQMPPSSQQRGPDRRVFTSQPVPQLSGGFIRRQQSNGPDMIVTTSFSAPIPVPASRGAGGGYRSATIELEPINTQWPQQPHPASIPSLASVGMHSQQIDTKN